MPLPKRTFYADVGQRSVGVSGPNQIENDLDTLFALFDPLDTLPDGVTPGGLGPENLRDYVFETPQLAQAKADQAEQNAKDYAMANLTTPVQAQALVDTHEAKKTNPHQVTATQVGALVSIDGVSNPGGNIDLVAGTGILLTVSHSNKTITITATMEAVPAPHAHIHAPELADSVSEWYVSRDEYNQAIDTLSMGGMI